MVRWEGRNTTGEKPDSRLEAFKQLGGLRAETESSQPLVTKGVERLSKAAAVEKSITNKCLCRYPIAEARLDADSAQPTALNPRGAGNRSIAARVIGGPAGGSAGMGRGVVRKTILLQHRQVIERTASVVLLRNPQCGNGEKA